MLPSKGWNAGTVCRGVRRRLMQRTVAVVVAAFDLCALTLF